MYSKRVLRTSIPLAEWRRIALDRRQLSPSDSLKQNCTNIGIGIDLEVFAAGRYNLAAKPQIHRQNIGMSAECFREKHLECHCRSRKSSLLKVR